MWLGVIAIRQKGDRNLAAADHFGRRENEFERE
jgi:hypothetical protein